MSLLEFGKAEIELDTGQLGIEGQGTFVGLGCLSVLLFLRENHAQTGICGSITGIAFSNSAPHRGSFGEFALLLESERIGRARYLRRRNDDDEDRGKQRQRRGSRFPTLHAGWDWTHLSSISQVLGSRVKSLVVAPSPYL